MASRQQGRGFVQGRGRSGRLPLECPPVPHPDSNPAFQHHQFDPLIVGDLHVEGGTQSLDHLVAGKNAERPALVAGNIDIDLAMLEGEQAIVLCILYGRPGIGIQLQRGTVRQRHAGAFPHIGLVQVFNGHWTGLLPARSALRPPHGEHQSSYHHRHRQTEGGDTEMTASTFGHRGAEERGKPCQRVHLVPRAGHFQQRCLIRRILGHPFLQRELLLRIQLSIHSGNPQARLVITALAAGKIVDITHDGSPPALARPTSRPVFPRTAVPR